MQPDTQECKSLGLFWLENKYKVYSCFQLLEVIWLQSWHGVLTSLANTGDKPEHSTFWFFHTYILLIDTLWTPVWFWRPYQLIFLIQYLFVLTCFEIFTNIRNASTSDHSHYRFLQSISVILLTLEIQTFCFFKEGNGKLYSFCFRVFQSIKRTFALSIK